jgi:hypothetical protein
VTGQDIHKARTILGELWGLDRPFCAAELGRALGLKGRDPGATVLAWEQEQTPVSGPVSLAIEAMLAGSFKPKMKRRKNRV